MASDPGGSDTRSSDAPIEVSSRDVEETVTVRAVSRLETPERRDTQCTSSSDVPIVVSNREGVEETVAVRVVSRLATPEPRKRSRAAAVLLPDSREPTPDRLRLRRAAAASLPRSSMNDEEGVVRFVASILPLPASRPSTPILTTTDFLRAVVRHESARRKLLDGHYAERLASLREEERAGLLWRKARRRQAEQAAGVERCLEDLRSGMGVSYERSRRERDLHAELVATQMQWEAEGQEMLRMEEERREQVAHYLREELYEFDRCSREFLRLAALEAAEERARGRGAPGDPLWWRGKGVEGEEEELRGMLLLRSHLSSLYLTRAPIRRAERAAREKVLVPAAWATRKGVLLTREGVARGTVGAWEEEERRELEEGSGKTEMLAWWRSKAWIQYRHLERWELWAAEGVRRAE
eukprot:Hpha_TRINITY_DN22347_c0_g1::TRINITY_DN22347_c0_g1_i1::g.177845::m.177845